MPRAYYTSVIIYLYKLFLLYSEFVYQRQYVCSGVDWRVCESKKRR